MSKRTVRLLDTPINIEVIHSCSDDRHALEQNSAGIKIHDTVKGGKVVSFDAERDGKKTERVDMQKNKAFSIEFSPAEIRYLKELVQKKADIGTKGWSRVIEKLTVADCNALQYDFTYGPFNPLEFIRFDDSLVEK